MLPDGEDVEPQLVGELGLLEEVAHPLLRAHAGREVGEGGEAEFHDAIHCSAFSCARNHLVRPRRRGVRGEQDEGLQAGRDQPRRRVTEPLAAWRRARRAARAPGAAAGAARRRSPPHGGVPCNTYINHSGQSASPGATTAFGRATAWASASGGALEGQLPGWRGRGGHGAESARRQRGGARADIAAAALPGRVSSTPARAAVHTRPIAAPTSSASSSVVAVGRGQADGLAATRRAAAATRRRSGAHSPAISNSGGSSSGTGANGSRSSSWSARRAGRDGRASHRGRRSARPRRSPGVAAQSDGGDKGSGVAQVRRGGSEPGTGSAPASRRARARAPTWSGGPLRTRRWWSMRRHSGAGAGHGPTAQDRHGVARPGLRRAVRSRACARARTERWSGRRSGRVGARSSGRDRSCRTRRCSTRACARGSTRCVWRRIGAGTRRARS